MNFDGCGNKKGNQTSFIRVHELQGEWSWSASSRGSPVVTRGMIPTRRKRMNTKHTRNVGQTKTVMPVMLYLELLTLLSRTSVMLHLEVLNFLLNTPSLPAILPTCPLLARKKKNSSTNKKHRRRLGKFHLYSNPYSHHNQQISATCCAENQIHDSPHSAELLSSKLPAVGSPMLESSVLENSRTDRSTI